MKHAVIIMAHNNKEVVKTAMRLLDDERFIILLHVDKKSPLDAREFIPDLKNSRCIILKRMPLNWGGWSYSQCLIDAIERALCEDIDYVHILQGADLPLKTPEQIDSFFFVRKGKNFIGFRNPPPHTDSTMVYRTFCKHFLMDNSRFRGSRPLRAVNYLLAKIQQPFAHLLNINNKVWCTSALFSISKEFALYIVKRKDKIRRKYRFTYIGEEIWIGTEFMKSPYKDTLADEDDARYIDWIRNEGSSPHTFTIDDFTELRNVIHDEKYIFARKFNEITQMEIVRLVENLVIS